MENNNLENTDLLETEVIEDPSKKPKNKKLNIISAILIVLIAVGLFVYMITVDRFRQYY